MWNEFSAECEKLFQLQSIYNWLWGREGERTGCTYMVWQWHGMIVKKSKSQEKRNDEKLFKTFRFGVTSISLECSSLSKGKKTIYNWNGIQWKMFHFNWSSQLNSIYNCSSGSCRELSDEHAGWSLRSRGGIEKEMVGTMEEFLILRCDTLQWGRINQRIEGFNSLSFHL